MIVFIKTYLIYLYDMRSNVYILFIVTIFRNFAELLKYRELRLSLRVCCEWNTQRSLRLRVRIFRRINLVFKRTSSPRIKLLK